MASFVASIYPFELDSVSSGLQLIEQFLLSHWIHLQEPLLLSTLPFRSSRLLDDQWKKPCPQKGQVIRGPFQVAEDWLSEWFAENFAVSFQVQTLRVGLCSQHGVCSSGNLAPPGELQRGLHSQPSSENGLEMLVISCGINLQLFDAFSVAQLPQRLDILKTSILFLGSWKLLEYQGAPCPSLPSAQTGGHTVTAGGCAGWRWPAKKNNDLPMKHDFGWHNTGVLMLFCCAFLFFCVWLFHLSQFEKLSVSNGCRKCPVCSTFVPLQSQPSVEHQSRQADPQRIRFPVQSLPNPFWIKQNLHGWEFLNRGTRPQTVRRSSQDPHRRTF